MSQLLDEIKKIQEATNCSLAEAKDAYDKASCDVDLAIELVKEGQNNKPQHFQEERKDGSNKNNSFFNSFSREKKETKQENPKTNKLFDQFTKEETREELVERKNKHIKSYTMMVILCVVLAIIGFALYFLVKKNSATLYMGILFTVVFLIGLLGIKRIKQSYDDLLYLVDKYPNVKVSQIKMVYLNHNKSKDKSLESMERDIRLLAGAEGIEKQQALENENLESTKKYANKTSRSNKLGPLFALLIVVVGLVIALPIIGNIYGTDFGIGEIFGGVSGCAQGGNPRKGYKLIKEDINNQAEALGIDEVKFSNAQYVMFYDTKPVKSDAISYEYLMYDPDCTIVIKFTYSYNLGGTQTKTEYWGYNPKTNEIKEFGSYDESRFNETKNQVTGGYYKGKTGSL